VPRGRARRHIPDPVEASHRRILDPAVARRCISGPAAAARSRTLGPGVARKRFRGPKEARRRIRGREPVRRRIRGPAAAARRRVRRGPGRAEASAGRAAAPERVEPSGSPGGGGGGGAEEEGGGSPPAGARPGPSRELAPVPRPGPAPGPSVAAAATAMARPLVPSSQKALLLELKGLQEEPVEGFRVTLVDEGDLYNWEVAIFGPPNTYYEGGYFKVSRASVSSLCLPLSQAPRAKRLLPFLLGTC
jgi:hypothetical protein